MMQQSRVAVALIVAITVLSGAGLAQTGLSPSGSVTFEDQAPVVGPQGQVDDLELARAQADVDYYVQLEAPNGTTLNRTQTFPADSVQRNLTLELAPPLSNTTNVTASVHASATGAELDTDAARIELRPRNATLRFPNRTRHVGADGQIEQLTVQRAWANVGYNLTLRTADGTTLNRTHRFPAGSAQRNLSLELAPALRNSTQVTVRIHANDTGRILANETARIELERVDTTLTVEDQRVLPVTEPGPQEIQIARANASVPFFVDVHGANGTQLEMSPTFAADHAQVDLTLEPSDPLQTDGSVTVELHAESGRPLAREQSFVRVGSQGTLAQNSSGPIGEKGAPWLETPGPSAGLLLGILSLAALSASATRWS